MKFYLWISIFLLLIGSSIDAGEILSPDEMQSSYLEDFSIPLSILKELGETATEDLPEYIRKQGINYIDLTQAKDLKGNEHLLANRIDNNGKTEASFESGTLPSVRLYQQTETLPDGKLKFSIASRLPNHQARIVVYVVPYRELLLHEILHYWIFKIRKHSQYETHLDQNQRLEQSILADSTIETDPQGNQFALVSPTHPLLADLQQSSVSAAIEARLEELAIDEILARNYWLLQMKASDLESTGRHFEIENRQLAEYIVDMLGGSKIFPLLDSKLRDLLEKLPPLDRALGAELDATEHTQRQLEVSSRFLPEVDVPLSTLEEIGATNTEDFPAYFAKYGIAFIDMYNDAKSSTEEDQKAYQAENFGWFKKLGGQFRDANLDVVLFRDDLGVDKEGRSLIKFFKQPRDSRANQPRILVFTEMNRGILIHELLHYWIARLGAEQNWKRRWEDMVRLNHELISSSTIISEKGNELIISTEPNNPSLKKLAIASIQADIDLSLEELTIDSIILANSELLKLGNTDIQQRRSYFDSNAKKVMATLTGLFVENDRLKRWTSAITAKTKTFIKRTKTDGVPQTTSEQWAEVAKPLEELFELLPKKFGEVTVNYPGRIDPADLRYTRILSAATSAALAMAVMPFTQDGWISATHLKTNLGIAAALAINSYMNAPLINDLLRSEGNLPKLHKGNRTAAAVTAAIFSSGTILGCVGAMKMITEY